ncbi:MAG: bacillithiol biosynthesis cysteine-adding enzyme BshC [Candidatus Korobacteraceae bacterium]
MPMLFAGDDRVIPDCISFASIPHTSKIFTDFLSYSSDARRFFPTQPDAAHIAAFAKSVPRDPQRQAAVADILARQNRSWGASEATLRNIERLRNGAFAVVTGQQVGLFGGPALALFKVASALALTKQVEALGVECVPVFWLASEDHDLAEVNQALLLTPDLQLAPFAANTAGIEGAPVASIRFAEGTNDLVARAAELLGDSLAADYLRESYAEGTSFSDAYAKLYARLFGEHGLILLTPSDTELHRIATPLFVDAARRAAELDEAILARNRELQSAGYHEQVKVTGESTPLFALADGTRVPVHRANGQFKIGRELVSGEEMQRRIEAAPQEFSANVLLRPVLQDYWLPTLAYVGGPAEIAYFAQAAVVYEKLLGRVTPILSRMSATLIEPRIERLLMKYEVDLSEMFHGECELRDCIAARSLPPELKQNFGDTRGAVDEAMKRVGASLQRLDSTLVEAATRATSKMQYQINRLEKRAAQAELRRSEIITRHAAQIENSLYPRKTLQEREIAGLYFHAKYGPPLIDRLIDLAQARCPEHKVLVLEA